jgi:hypothetical protein
MHDDRVSIDDVEIEYLPRDEREDQTCAYRILHTGEPIYNVTRDELREFTVGLLAILVRHEGEDS